MKASQMASWTNIRWTLMHSWPGVLERALDAALCGPVEVRARIHDDAGVATELEHDLLLAGPLLHPPADARAAGERAAA